MVNTMQAQVIENFSDGDFTTNPIWSGDIANWKVVNNQLNSNAPTTSAQTFLTTFNSLAQNTQWEFTVNLKFATSSANYTDIFLISDSLNLLGQNSGFFVRVGNTADEISLYRKDGPNSVKIIDGLDGRVSSTTTNLFRIKITRTPDFEFKLYDDISGTGSSFNLEGSVVDSTYLSTFGFGFLLKYSSANIQKFFFDDIHISTIINDTTPPILDSIWAEDSFSCVLKFNEAIDTISGFNLSNYDCNGTNIPTSIQRYKNSVNEIILHFPIAFKSKQLQVIATYNIRDAGGNKLNYASKSFRYVNIQSGDLVINEIFADPSPTIGLPAYEFVELWNTSGVDLNLFGVKITDGTSMASFPEYILPRDSFIIVSSISSANCYSKFGNSIILSSFPSLNNDAEHLQLLNLTNTVLDDVGYNLSSYNNILKADGGWTLELINPNNRCKNNYNWTASNNSILGGTPGMLNSVFDLNADTVAPKVRAFTLINDTSAWLVFSTVMDSNTVAQITINSSTNIHSKLIINNNADSLYLTFDGLINQAEYSFSFSKAYSCNGIKMPSSIFSFRFDKALIAAFNDIVITEILVNPLTGISLPNSQYVELKNRSYHSVNLKGMRLTDGATTATLPDFKLLRDSIIVIAPASKANEFASKTYATLFITSFPYLNTDKDQLILKDSNDRVINAMHYDIKTLNNSPKYNGGWSIEITDVNNSCINLGNWNYSIDPNGGTPGKPNSSQATINDVSVPNLIRGYTKARNEIILIFSKSIDLIPSSLAFKLQSNPSLPQNFETRYHQNNLNEISLLFPNDVLPDDIIFSLNINSFMDCGGHEIDSTLLQLGYPSIPSYGDIAINEILFNAAAYGSEFIELYNTSSKIFDLNNTALSCFSKSGNTMGMNLASDITWQLLPGQYVAIATNSNDIVTRYRCPSPQSIFTSSVWKTLDDDSGLVVIATLNNLEAIDSAYFSKRWHHPFIANDEGVSLERVHYLRDGKIRSSWLSASSNVGYATPGYQNSKFSNKPLDPDFVSISKLYFTPDNDGFEDELNFTITLPSENYAINITIYDINGNEIKRLAQNDIAGITNFYVWDGRNANGNISNVGHYILYIQATDKQGKAQIKKEVIDLLMR